MENQEHKLYKLFANLFRLFLLGAIVGNVLTQNWFNLFASVLMLLLTYLPLLLEEKAYIYIPPSFQMIILVFIFASLYLGELNEYYLKFWWWDIMLHTLSGIILGFIGFILIYILNRDSKVNLALSGLFIAIFSFTFAVTAGVLWEIFEFAMDSLLGSNMQKSGLDDTMGDLIVDALGALFTSTIGYIYSKKKGTSYLRNLIKDLISKEEEVTENDL
ncbi:hypothetical protein [Orenia marismortui]|uniref:Membrane-spanning protein n=1 Tax=Orenia marismortui TaxID=46469 RepID=A0A4R8H9D9_9FIRM|nr:hypothetical protein [Orenia marismortui]TDX52124.1 hypothetical protein C7959_10846 [Orenia marismortui]